MRKVKWILIVALLAAGGIYGIQYMARMGADAQTDQTCATLAHRLTVRLLREPNPEVPDSRLQSMLRDPGVLGPVGPIARNADGWPVDAWGTVFRATIIEEHGKRHVEVRSAGPDGVFDTDDDFFAHEEF